METDDVDELDDGAHPPPLFQGLAAATPMRAASKTVARMVFDVSLVIVFFDGCAGVLCIKRLDEGQSIRCVLEAIERWNTSECIMYDDAESNKTTVDPKDIRR